MTTRAQVDAWRALADATMAAPWGVDTDAVWSDDGWVCEGGWPEDDGTLDRDLTFIAASRTAVPEMADTLERAMTALADWWEDPDSPPDEAWRLLTEWRGEV